LCIHAETRQQTLDTENPSAVRVTHMTGNFLSGVSSWRNAVSDVGQRENSHNEPDQNILRSLHHSRRRHRYSISIIAAILKITRRDVKKTHIMHRANLSFAQLQDYLSFLMRNGLVTRFTDDQELVAHYRITPKGLVFLQRFESMNEVLNLYDGPTVQE